MLKLIRFLKPYLVFIAVAVVLLFIQAMSELALPDYMSRIVNDGIQQGGIETSIPEALRKTTMDHLGLFLSAEDKQEVLRYYTLVTKDSPNYDRLLQEYPALETEDIYVINNEEDLENSELSLIMGKALIVISGIDQAKAEAVDGFFSFSGLRIPETADPYVLIQLLPQARRISMVAEMSETFLAMGDTMIEQASVGAVKAEYEALGVDTGKIQSNYILRTGALMLLITLLSAACTIMVGFLAAKVAAGSARDIRKALFSKVEHFSNLEFDQFSTASLITRTTNDITQVQMVLVMMIRMVFYAPILGTGGVIRALDKSASMSWIIALAVIVLLGFILVIFSIAVPKFKRIQKLIDRLNLVTRENLSGLMVIRAFISQDFEEERFDRSNIELTKNTLFVNRLMSVMMPAMMLIMNGVMLLIVWVGAHQIAESGMQVGDMMAFMQYAMQIIFSFLMLSIMFIMIPRASVSANRIAEVLAVKPQINDPEKPEPLDPRKEGQVEFRNVSFRFPGAEEDMLKDISFHALPGQTTAIIGPTGSGKSTLVNLIPRFYDVTQGQVIVDGVDVRNATQHELRSRIGYVPQKGILFSGTIESNLKYADENASMEEVENAAQIAQAMEFIDEKPERFAEHISQGGSNVSGGQKQRLSIARALLKKPPIYIFDDSFSALDYKTDVALRRKLREQTGSSTVLIVGQRVATIKNADQILVLDEGRIVGAGKHKTLMETCSTYREIAFSQLSKEELE
ncbi:MAG TPA: ABC transporter ATP-binding protein [Thermotogota bacterium]|nr:ABC transporter ATP-binding protein [Thermotogota bacterium]HRW93844.1 ABC transporter ATP-binding protein [Thermotogota bacterium]